MKDRQDVSPKTEFSFTFRGYREGLHGILGEVSTFSSIEKD